MDSDPHPSFRDARVPRRDLLLRHLARLMDELAQIGVQGPAAFEDLLRRNPTPISPLR